jgi:hypothetical protein
MTARVVDYTALTTPITHTEVAAWRAQAKASGASWAAVNLNTVVGVAMVSIFGIFFVVIGGGLAVTVTTAGLGGGNTARALVPLVLVGIVIAIVAARALQRLRGGGKWARWLRIARFAQANGMTFSPVQGNPSYPGEIFQLGRDRAAIDHVSTSSGRFLDLGNYRWTTGSGKEQQTRTWGFLAIRLDRNMPNMVLDSKANNSLFGSNLPASLDKKQILHLEGDFDRYFTLYCPAGYETDALVIFTPDLMTLLIDEAAPFDVELVDDWMFVYSTTAFDMASPAVYQRLFRIADTIGTKALAQTERYVDARVGSFDANVVAPQGARLKHGVSVAAIAFVAVFLAFWGWGFVGPIVAGLGGR